MLSFSFTYGAARDEQSITVHIAALRGDLDYVSRHQILRGHSLKNVVPPVDSDVVVALDGGSEILFILEIIRSTNDT